MAEIGIMKKLTIGGKTYTLPEYSLPIASASTLGGVRVGSGLTIESGTGILSATGTDITIDSAMDDSSTHPVQNQVIKAYIDEHIYENLEAEADGTDLSVVTTGEKYEWNQKTSNTGTVRSVTLTSGTGISVSNSGTAITTTGSRTISLASVSGLTPDSYGPNAGGTLNYGSTFKVPYVTVDSYGRITEISAKTFTLPAAQTIPTVPTNVSAFTNDAGYLTSYTETDPTVPDWAKTESKPTYTYTEVGAAASSHTHGNITNGGDITSNVNIANGDRIVINDESASKLANSSITFGTSTNQYLANNGTWQSIPSVPDVSDFVTQSDIDTAIANLPEPMIFKGSLGTTGTITSLPSATANNEGFTYKVITAGTYDSQVAKIGDTFISDGNSWILIPSGDEPSGTVTSITLKAGTGISLDTDNTAITTSGTRTISLATITKNNSTSTASPSHGGTFTAVDTITYDNYGRVTGINTKTITLPSDNNTDTKVKLTSTSTNAAYKLALGPSSITSGTAYEGYYSTHLTYNPSTKAFVTGGTVDGYTLADASEKSVDTSISASSNSTNLPTSAAVASFVEGKGYITSADVPEGASAYTGTISAIGTAASTGTNNGFARGDHVHNLTKTTVDSVLGTGSGTVKFYREDGTWATPAYTTNTDEKMKWTASNSTNTYYPLQSINTAATEGANTLNSVSFYQYYNTAGGYRRLILGNNTTYTSSGGAYGTIRLYGPAATYYGDLNPGTIGTASGDGHLTANRTWTLPNQTGTIALTSDIPTTVTSSTTGITASTTATKTSLGTASSIYGVGSDTTTASKASGGNGTAASWTFESKTVANSISGAVDNIDNTLLVISLGTTSVQSKSGGSNGSAPTWSFTDVTVPIKNVSATSVPNISVTSATVSIVDNGHTHELA